VNDLYETNQIIALVVVIATALGIILWAFINLRLLLLCAAIFGGFPILVIIFCGGAMKILEPIMGGFGLLVGFVGGIIATCYVGLFLFKIFDKMTSKPPAAS
jgi:hypothetical protein